MNLQSVSCSTNRRTDCSNVQKTFIINSIREAFGRNSAFSDQNREGMKMWIFSHYSLNRGCQRLQHPLFVSFLHFGCLGKYETMGDVISGCMQTHSFLVRCGQGQERTEKNKEENPLLLQWQSHFPSENKEDCL